MISTPFLQLLSTIVSMYAMLLLARMGLAWTKAGLSNPIIIAIYRLTQPVVLPLKKLIRNFGRFETASFLILLLCALLSAGFETNFAGSLYGSFLYALKVLVDWIYYFYLFAIIIVAVMSFIITDPYHPLYMTLQRIVDPLLGPFRRLLQRFTGNIGLDFSPIIVLLLLSFLRSVVYQALQALA